MDLTEAFKKVKAEKPRENYMVVEFSYNNRFVIPHSAGIAFLSAMSHAEKLHDSYGEPKRITEFEKDQYSVRPMAFQEYERYKVAALLNISPDDVKEMLAATQKVTSETPTTTP